jgi:uncharacterized phage protein gp47/JayE
VAYQRPTLSELIEDLRDSFRTAFVAAGRPLEAFVRNTVPWVLTRVWGDALHNLYGLLEYAHRQILAGTADTEWLEKHANDVGLTRLEAEKSAGPVNFIGFDTTVIPLGTALVRGDGVQYVTTATGAISGSVGQVTAECVTPGAIGNMSLGAQLTLVTPIVGLNDVAFPQFVGAAWTNGADVETDEALRERVLLRKQRPPQGGAAVDYEQWARLVLGVTKVWVEPLGRGAGTVDVYFLHADGTGIGIPTVGQVADVQGEIDARRPVVADALAIAPTAVPVAFTIEISPDTAGNRAAIEAELDALFLLKAGSGSDIFMSDYWAAVTSVVGAGVDSVSITVPSTTTSVGVGQVATRGTITWL